MICLLPAIDHQTVFQIMLVFLLFALSASVHAGTDEKLPLPDLDPALKQELTDWLDKNGKSPVDYVVGLFDTRDVVILGELHRIKHDEELIQSLLAPLYEHGVHTLGTEFARREDQPLIDSLLALPEWNEELAREIIFKSLVSWGYQDYVDILHAAWNVNKARNYEEPLFHVVAMGDSPDWSYIRTPEDQRNPEARRNVWSAGGTKQYGEQYWGYAVLGPVMKGEKVLVHSGQHHAFTRYKQPVVADGKFFRYGDVRMGNYLQHWLGNRVAMVALHSPWSGRSGYDADYTYPAGGVIDALMLGREGGPQPVGFDVVDGPFGDVEIDDAVYCRGHEPFKLADFCDGWIYTKPFSEYEGVTPIEGWVNEDNIEYARKHDPDVDRRNATIEEFNASVVRASQSPVPTKIRHLR